MHSPLSLHQVKIIILHTVFAIPGPIPRHVIETALALSDANIFEIQEALHDLIKNENLLQKDDENQIPYLFITDQGRCIVDALKKDAPLSYREKAMAFATAEMSKLRTEIGVDATVCEETKNGIPEYYCDLSLSDEGTPMLNLSMYSPNKLQADMIAERFRKNPTEIYRKILHILTGTDSEEE